MLNHQLLTKLFEEIYKKLFRQRLQKLENQSKMKQIKNKMKNKLQFLKNKIIYPKKKKQNNPRKSSLNKANLNLINLNQIVKKFNLRIIKNQINKMKSKKMTNNF